MFVRQQNTAQIVAQVHVPTCPITLTYLPNYVNIFRQLSVELWNIGCWRIFGCKYQFMKNVVSRANIIYNVYERKRLLFKKKSWECFAGFKNCRTFASANEAYPFLESG